MYVEDGTIANITCEVFGGFPNTTKLTLECAGEPIVNGSLFITRDLMDQDCICTGDHITGCYDKETKAQLIVICEFYYVTLSCFHLKTKCSINL